MIDFWLPGIWLVVLGVDSLGVGWWCFVTYAGGVGWVLCGCGCCWLGFADDVVVWWFIVDFCCV